MSEKEPDAVEFIRALVAAWDCCATCAGGVLARRDRLIVAAALNEAADQVERELVCCDVFERLHGKGGLELTAEQKRERRHHAICFWSEASARIVRNLAATSPPARTRP